MDVFILTPDHERWANVRLRTREYKRPKPFWLDLITQQRGLCAFSGAPLLFGSSDGTPVAGGHSQHPIYAVVDHSSPGTDSHGYQIVSNDLNDLKGHLNPELFDALRRTNAWMLLMERWRKQALVDSSDRSAFRLLRRGVV